MIAPKKALLLFSIVFILIFLFFYPSVPQISDESEYFRNAYLLTQGTFFVTEPEYAYWYVDAHDKFSSRYPLTASLFHIPFMIFGLYSLFLFGLFFFFLGLYYFVKLLKNEGLSEWWGLLYLGYIPFIFHSTTIMVDLPGTALITAAFYYYSRSKYLYSGIFAALAVLLKVTNIIPAAIMGLFILIRELMKHSFAFNSSVLKSLFKKCIMFSLPLIISVLIILVQRTIMYGGPFTDGYFLIHNNETFLFSKPDFWSLFFGNVLNYLLFLNIFYPLMLIACLVSSFKLKKEVLLFAVLFIPFHSLINNFPSITPSGLIIDFRQVFLMIPLFLIGYAAFFEQFIIPKFSLFKKYFPAIMVVFCIFAFILTIPLLGIKQESSERGLSIIDDIYSRTQENSLILGVQEANYFNEYFGKRGYFVLLRPLAFEDSWQLAKEKTEQYLNKGEKVYLLYVNASHYSYKKGVTETFERMNDIKTQYAGKLILQNEYPIKTPYYSNSLSLELYELS